MAHEIKLKSGAINYILREEGLANQRRVAEAMNLSPAHLSQILSGQKGVTSAFIVGAYLAFGYQLNHPIYHIVKSNHEYHETTRDKERAERLKRQRAEKENVPLGLPS